MIFHILFYKNKIMTFNQWCMEVFRGYDININSLSKLKFINNLTENEPLKNVKEIKIKNISVSYFPFYLFPNLKFLVLSDVLKIECLMECFFECRKLEILSMNDIELDKFPKNIEKCRSLKIISIFSSSIEKLPETIGNLSLLEELHLQQCFEISYLPLTLKNCKLLENISISNCNFKEFPSILFELENLKNIDISSNDISILPEKISILKKLDYLKIDNTKIKEIPDSIELCVSLREIHAKNSYLETIPETIGKLENLEYLYCPGTRLKIIPENLLCCSKIKIIDVEKTYVEKLPNLGVLTNLKLIDTIYTHDTPYDKKDNNIVSIDISREGIFQKNGKYMVQYISIFEKDRFEKIKFLSRQSDFKIPEKYKCSICYELFKSPRTTCEGNTYCRKCISEWFSCENTDPNTNKIIQNKEIFPHHIFENEYNQFIDTTYQKYF